MGQEQINAIGGCCSTEEIKEVMERDAKQTLDFDQGGDSSKPGQQQQNFKSEVGTKLDAENKFQTPQMSPEEATIRIQANFRGIMARRAIRDKFQDKTLNSVTNSFLTGSVIGRLEKVMKHVLKDGARYSGYVLKAQQDEDLVPEGRGKIKWPNGDKYSGYFKGGLPHGKGTKIIADKNTVIEGLFRNGLAHGQGKMTRANAEGIIEFHYEGNFLMD